jgi:hypothetical protein
VTSINSSKTPARPPHRSPRWIIATFAAVIGMAAAVVLVVTLRGGDGERTARFEVSAEGTEVMRLTYGSRDETHGLRSDRDTIELPWSAELQIPEGAGGVLVSAMNARPGVGTITCRLLVGGKVVVERTNSDLVDCTARTEDILPQ